MNTQSLQTYPQTNVGIYIVLTVCLSFLFIAWGVVGLFQTASIAYQVSESERKISQINQSIAELESQYFAQTRDITVSDSRAVAMQQYSPESQRVRYAQVGGATYSLVTDSGR